MNGGADPLKAVYSNGSVYIIKVEDELYYYGDGVNINAYGQNAVQFLRFNPHLKDVSAQKIDVPDGIAKEIKEHLESVKNR